MSKIIGLTGNIASGKTYVADVFRSVGAAVQDADKVAHEVMDTKAFSEILKEFPEAVEDGKINRRKLGDIVFNNSAKLEELEAILHPLVREQNLKFIEENAHNEFVIIEVPLLFEAGFNKFCDYTVFVNVSEQTQKKRALTRAGMTEEKLQQILARKIPAEKKLKLADFVIDNEDGADILKQVKQILAKCAK